MILYMQCIFYIPSRTNGKLQSVAIGRFKFPVFHLPLLMDMGFGGIVEKTECNSKGEAIPLLGHHVTAHVLLLIIHLCLYFGVMSSSEI